MKKTLTYDHALNEIIRLALRLEKIFDQIDTIDQSSQHGIMIIIDSILDVARILDRPDLKSKFIQLLSQLYYYLKNNTVEICANDLDKELIMNHLNRLISLFQTQHGYLTYKLHQDHLFAMLWKHAHLPGGPCQTTIPLFNLWSFRPQKEKIVTINNWLKSLQPIKQTVELLLFLSRKIASPKLYTATDSFFQLNLDPKMFKLLVQIKIEGSDIYPKISIGQHRLSIHFYTYIKKDYMFVEEVNKSESIVFKLLCTEIP
jgi:cell division protein ZapD